MDVQGIDDTLPLDELARRMGVNMDAPNWPARTVELAVGWMLGNLDRWDRQAAEQALLAAFAPLIKPENPQPNEAG